MSFRNMAFSPIDQTVAKIAALPGPRKKVLLQARLSGVQLVEFFTSNGGGGGGRGNAFGSAGGKNHLDCITEDAFYCVRCRKSSSRRTGVCTKLMVAERTVCH